MVMNILLWVLIGFMIAFLVRQAGRGTFARSKNQTRTIVERSNVIQFDEMGYPLRLVIMSDGNQIWLDTTERDGDVVLKWAK